MRAIVAAFNVVRTPVRATLVLASLVLASLALSACSGGPGNLKPETPTGVNLAGNWILNRQKSQDPQAMIEVIRQKELKQFMKRRRDYGDSVDDDALPDIDTSPTPSGSSGSRRGSSRGGAQQQPSNGSSGDGGSGQERRGRFMPRLPYAPALGAALTADTMKIEQSATRFVITRGDDRRSFTPGGDSVVSVPNGVADQHSGWSGRDYVIDVRPQLGTRVVERYGLSAGGRQLVETFTLTGEGWPKLEFTRVYDSGTLTPRVLPTSN